MVAQVNNRQERMKHLGFPIVSKYFRLGRDATGAGGCLSNFRFAVRLSLAPLPLISVSLVGGK